ncbi:helix-turn-helix domain-containing protein [Listeria rocourtiae]|uniref:helix-turn-helix domain-containing protein n=1 Tax=Listeria rocourtiae TaxID=647910 RepID=UPI003D2F5D52
MEARELALCLAKQPEWTHQEIAAHLQVSRETVMKYIKQYHLLYLPKNKKEKKKIDRDALHAFVVAHPELSVLKVAKHFGVSEATMKKRMEKYHIPYRTPRNNGYH